MQNYFDTFYFGEFKPHSFNTRVMPIKVGIVSHFNFAGAFSSRNVQHKRFYSIDIVFDHKCILLVS